jgi:hypothetical protein
MGVYLPYMVVGLNSRAELSGQGERLLRKYTVTTGSGKNKKTTTYYDADLYDVERKFDLVVDGLTIISSSGKLDRSSDRTNNIINAVKPFDNENCVRWDANYLRGFASEKRDTNIEDLKSSVEMKAKDIARHNANATLTEYDRGVKWSSEKMDIKGQQWKAAYLPIWLYSYQQLKVGGKSLLHYVAVNARTQKTMGSVPVNKLKLLAFSFIVQIFGLIAMLLTMFSLDENGELGLVFLLAGFIFYTCFYMKYRNKGARFEHEKDTKATMNNIQGSDKFVKRMTRLKNSKMNGANHLAVNYNKGSGKSLVEVASGLRDKLQ